MDFRFLSPLLKPKKAMDSLLESMTTDDYDSLGAHRRGESTPESKGTEFDGTLNGQGFAPSGIVIPSKDLAPPSDPATAEFFKSEPKQGAIGQTNPTLDEQEPVMVNNCATCGADPNNFIYEEYMTVLCGECGTEQPISAGNFAR